MRLSGAAPQSVPHRRAVPGTDGFIGKRRARDSRIRLYSYNRVQDYPLVVLVGLDEAAGFAGRGRIR